MDSSIDYTPFATTFSKSRKNLVWPEMEYCIELLANKTESHSPLRILDVGCGNGRFLSFLQKTDLSYVYRGIDSSEGMVTEAKKEHPEADFSVIDMLDLSKLPPSLTRWMTESERVPWGRGGMGGEFDCITFFASFHHLKTEEERLRVLSDTQRLLAPDGFVFMTNWNLMGQTLFPKYESMYRENGDFDIKIGAHSRYYHGFTTQELADLFGKTDWKVQENRLFEGERNIVSVTKKED